MSRAEAPLPEGVIFEAIAAGEAPAIPPSPDTLSLYRTRLAPGAALTLPAGDPGLALIYVESGELTVRITEPIVVNHATATGPDGTAERVPAHTTVVLSPGDSFVAPPNSGGEFRNDGTKELIGLVAALEPVGAGIAGPSTSP